MSDPAAPVARLPPAPQRLIENGELRSGLFAGSVQEADFSALAHAPGLLERRLIEKKWQYVFLATPDMMMSLAIIDCGYLSSGICAVFDRGARRLLIDDNPVLPPFCASVADSPGEGMSARLIGLGVRARMERKQGRILVRASWAHAEIDLVIDASRAPQPMSAAAPAGPSGRFDFTQKTVLAPAEGEVRAGNIRFPVQGAFAGLDYTHGLLARETSWRWAFAGGRAGSRLVAFNLSEGFLQGEGENVVWLGGDPRAVGKVSFAFDPAKPLGAWRLQSEDGRLDLTFDPEGYRAQAVDLKLISSRYLQPFGIFRGRIDGAEIEGLPGVTEDHAARW